MNSPIAILTLLALVSCTASQGSNADEDAGSAPESDAGAQPNAGQIPLVSWIDELVENRTSDQAQPDTIDDKNVVNTEDPSAFDHLLP